VLDLTFSNGVTPRTQQLYFLKKIHKNPIAVRPIVSGCGGPTEKLSQLVDLHLQPFVPQIKSYIRDSTHLINILETTTIPRNSVLATIDVKSLYLNIPHKDGIQAVKNRVYYNNKDSENVAIPPGTMSDLLNIVLKHNYFQFADRMYHQVQGTAMGTKMAPAYANIFMAELEEKLLENSTTDPYLWKRYIDDILCIWPGDEKDLERFIAHLNRSHPTIKFTYECSKTSVDFLDITIYKGERYRATGKLDIKPHFKKTNKFQYLEFTSAHPRNTFKSLIKGEMTRLLRACSSEQEYTKIQQKMFKLFKERGYPTTLIKTVQQSVPFAKRAETLQTKEATPQEYETFFVTEYTPDLNTHQIKQLLKPTSLEEHQIPKACLSLKKAKNLRQTLVRAKLKDTSPINKSTTPITIATTPNLHGHSAGCGTPGCKCCRAMSRKFRVTSRHNGKSFSIPKHTNCNTDNVIYLLECKRCDKRNQYVGQTCRPLSHRVAGHRARCKIKINLPVYKHFTEPDHNFERDAGFTILEKTTTEKLDDRERHWITTLDTVYPKGLNSRFDN